MCTQRGRNLSFGHCERVGGALMQGEAHQISDFSHDSDLAELLETFHFEMWRDSCRYGKESCVIFKRPDFSHTMKIFQHQGGPCQH